MKRTEAQSANRSRDQEQDGEYGGGEAIAKLQVHCPLEDVNLYTCWSCLPRAGLYKQVKKREKKSVLDAQYTVLPPLKVLRENVGTVEETV